MFERFIDTLLNKRFFIAVDSDNNIRRTSSRIGIVTTSSGNGYEMTAVAACVLGGISLTGGVGSVIGSAIGAVIMSSISYLLVFMGFSSNYNDAITGSILIVIVVVDSVMQIRSRMKLRHERLQARTRDDMVTEGENA